MNRWMKGIAAVGFAGLTPGFAMAQFAPAPAPQPVAVPVQTPATTRIAPQPVPVTTPTAHQQPGSTTAVPTANLPGPIDNLEDLRSTAKMVFKLADTNMDNQISKAEATDFGNGLVGGVFFRADANGDGVVSQEEADLARENIFKQRPWLRYVLDRVNSEVKSEGDKGLNQIAKSIGATLDANSDKQIQASEVRQAVQTVVQALYATADTNGDGQMSTDEVNNAALGAAQTVAKAAFQAADQDKSGQISRDEFLSALKGPAEAVFAVLDGNRDDQLSAQELEKAQRVIVDQITRMSVSDGSVQPASYQPPQPLASPSR